MYAHIFDSTDNTCFIYRPTFRRQNVKISTHGIPDNNDLPENNIIWSDLRDRIDNIIIAFKYKPNSNYRSDKCGLVGAARSFPKLLHHIMRTIRMEENMKYK